MRGRERGKYLQYLQTASQKCKTCKTRQHFKIKKRNIKKYFSLIIIFFYCCYLVKECRKNISICFNQFLTLLQALIHKSVGTTLHATVAAAGNGIERSRGREGGGISCAISSSASHLQIDRARERERPSCRLYSATVPSILISTASPIRQM